MKTMPLHLVLALALLPAALRGADSPAPKETTALAGASYLCAAPAQGKLMAYSRDLKLVRQLRNENGMHHGITDLYVMENNIMR